ncbi:MAG: ABC transporter permease [Paracoccaceae bacterium]|nr:ABC transporter permease [Paracoccaceae bacterium]
MLSNVWFIARTDLRFALRDRSTLLWLILMPPVFFFFFFFFIGNMTAGGIGTMVTKGRVFIEAPAEDPLSARFTDLVAENGFVIDPEASRRLLIEDGKATYHAGEPTPATRMEELRLQKATLMLRAETAVVAARDGEITLADLGTTPPSITVSVEPAGRLGRVPTGFEQAVPGILVMFTILVLLTSGGILLLMEREQDMLRRLASAPMLREEIIAGKWLGRTLLAVAQIGIAMLFGTALFGMDSGDSLPVVLVILAGWAALCASLGLLGGSLGRNQAEVGGLGMLLTVIMAAFGRAWWPIEVTPGWMQALQKAVPAGWTMDAMHRLISFGDAPLSILPHLAALVTAALAIAWAAVRAFKFD